MSQSPLLHIPSRARRLWRFLFPIIIEEVAEIVFDIPFRGEVGRLLCQLLDGLVAFPRDRIARIDLTPRPAEGRKSLTGHLQVQIVRQGIVPRPNQYLRIGWDRRD